MVSPAKEEAQASFEFGGAVGGSQDGARLRSRGFADRQAVEAQPQHVAGFVGILDEFLALVVRVAVHNPNCCMARWPSWWLAC